jgi:integrase
MFLFDTGIRSPTELINIKVSDFYNDFKELNIREEISKTFGRRIKLMLCPQLIRDYVLYKGLKSENYLFEISPSGVNKYLKRLALRILGENISPAGQKYSELTMYDFRHNSCCYWLPRYKSESALKYRFGWKKSEKIHYYSELLGMKDTIAEEDMLVDVTKTEIEKRLERSENEKEILHERLTNMESQMQKIMELTNRLHAGVIA